MFTEMMPLTQLSGGGIPDPEVLLYESKSIAGSQTYNTNIKAADARAISVYCALPAANWYFMLCGIFEDGTYVPSEENVSNGVGIYVNSDGDITVRNQNGFGNTFATNIFITN